MTSAVKTYRQVERDNKQGYRSAIIHGGSRYVDRF